MDNANPDDPWLSGVQRRHISSNKRSSSGQSSVASMFGPSKEKVKPTEKQGAPVSSMKATKKKGAPASTLEPPTKKPIPTWFVPKPATHPAAAAPRQQPEKKTAAEEEQEFQKAIWRSRIFK